MVTSHKNDRIYHDRKQASPDQWPWPCPCMQRSQLPEARWRRAPHFFALGMNHQHHHQLWKWGFIPKKKNWLKIHEMLDLKIESSKTAGEQWLFKYQYSIFYSLTNKKCGFVENRMVINSCGMMGLVTWFKWRLKKRKSRVKMEAEGTKHLTLMSKIGMQLD